jgi:hypothetical protein
MVASTPDLVILRWRDETWRFGGPNWKIRILIAEAAHAEEDGLALSGSFLDFSKWYSAILVSLIP